MSALDLTFTDLATPGMRRVITRLEDRHRLHAEMGMSVGRLVIRHLRLTLATKPNKLGAPSTGFWQKAISSISANATEEAATISIRHQGVRLQYHGGTVRPTRAKALTIPISPLAHGKRVGDFSKGSIFMLPIKRGQSIGILARKFGRGKSARIEPLYVLRRSATIRPHPEILPTEAEIGEAAATALTKYLERQ